MNGVPEWGRRKMAVDEGAEHRLYQRLEQVLGTEGAATLMRRLPTAGFDYSQLATKEDLRQAIGSLRHELHADMERLNRRVVMWTSSMMLAGVGLAFAAGRFV
jgi:hypothetical protein